MTAEIVNLNQYRMEKIMNRKNGYRGFAYIVTENAPYWNWGDAGVEMPNITVTVDMPEKDDE